MRRIFIVLAILAGFSVRGGAAVALDAHSTIQDSNGAPTLTFSYTVGASATVLFVKAGIYIGLGETITSITYNGTAMTKIEDNNGSIVQQLRGYIYYMNSPPAGAHNVVVTASLTTPILLAEAESWTGTNTSYNWPDTATNQCGTVCGGPVSCSGDDSAPGFPVTFLALGNEACTSGGPPTMTTGYDTVLDFAASDDISNAMSMYVGEKTAATPLTAMSADFDDAGIISVLNVGGGAAGGGGGPTAVSAGASGGGASIHGGPVSVGFAQ